MPLSISTLYCTSTITKCVHISYLKCNSSSINTGSIITFSRSFCLNLDANFYFFIIIELSIKPSRDPMSDSPPPPRDPDLGRNLRLGTTALR
jgi:hypothetical protein